MRRSISLRTYFSLSLGLLMILMTVILTVLIGKQSIEEVKYEVGESLSQTAHHMAGKMDSYMWARSGEIYTLSKLDTLHDLNDPDSIRQLLEELKNNFTAFAWIGVTDVNGTVVAATQSLLEGKDISQRPVFINGMQGNFVGDVHDAVLLANLLPNPTGEPMKFVDISVPILDASGQAQGVLAAHLSWEWAAEMKKIVMEPLSSYKELEMFVLSANDHIVLLGPEEQVGQKLNLPGIDSVHSDSTYWTVETWEDEKEYLTGYALENGYMNYKGLGWTILVRQPASLAYSRVRALQVYIILAGCACAFLFSFSIWFIAGRITKPIVQISKVAEKLQLGQPAQFPSYTGVKEIEALHVSLRELFNSLTLSETARDEMETVAHRDFLTGIPNRTGLEKYLSRAIQNPRLKNSQRLSFFCLDLDGFKSVNDTYGHHIGDILLQNVAERLTASVRSDEIVARLGGDEFVVILLIPRETAFENAKAIAERIIRELNEPFQMDGFTVKVGCSIGGAFLTADTEAHQTMQYADEALYSSKRAGKNCVTFYEQTLD